MNITQKLWIVFLLLYSSSGVLSLNILGVFTYPGKSHFFVFEPYLQELARRGHNVTVISYFPQEKPMDNYHDISLAGKMNILESVFPVHRSYGSLLQVAFFLYEMGRSNCKILLEDEKVQDLWRTEAKFDLVVTEQFNTDCPLALAYKIGAPVVTMTANMLMPWHYERLGIHYNPSYIPFLLLEGGTKPTLYERLERIVFHNVGLILYKYTCERENEKQVQNYFDTPPLADLARNIKIVLLYTHFAVNGPAVYPPNVIEVGGYHVAKPKELPKDLKKFIEESEHGVIYISFGSMLLAASTPKDKVKAIVEAISEIPQRVVWKWDGKVLPGNPKNVYISHWLPQNDILAHPKVVAFYSHCGMLSTTEAIYHAVPMIGMPVFGDQPANAAAMEESGLGVQIQIRDLTKESLLQKIKIVLDPEFKRKVKELSTIWHDRPASAMDTAIYWTEFAARTKNYTFRSPATNVPMYQYLYLDIMSVLVGISLVVILVFKFIWSLFRTTSQQKSLKVKTK